MYQAVDEVPDEQLGEWERVLFSLKADVIQIQTDEAFFRELEVQILSNLPFSERLFYVLAHPWILFHYIFRIRRKTDSDNVQFRFDTEPPQPLRLQHPDSLVSRAFARVRTLEQRLPHPMPGAKDCIQLAEVARWLDLDMQILAKRPFASRLAVLFRHPVVLPRYLIRVRNVLTPTRVGDLSPTRLFGV